VSVTPAAAPKPLPPPGWSATPLSLTPRRADRAACPKCGGPDTSMMHKPATGPCDRGCCGPQAERFDRWCRTCRWQWTTHDVNTPAGA
jgi:hypothetical protein